MKNGIIFILLTTLHYQVAGCQTFRWESAPPEEMGFSSLNLAALRGYTGKI